MLILAVHLLATIAKLVRPGGVRVVVAEFLLIKQQLLISSRARRRLVAGLFSGPKGFPSAVVVRCNQSPHQGSPCQPLRLLHWRENAAGSGKR
jgi:hypothetical protein